MNFSFSNITVEYKGQLILNNIQGHAKAGEMLALMGSSGSGKTTLLNYLSFRRSLIGLQNKNMKGSVMVNGVEISKKYRQAIAYVPQENYLFPYATLKEILTFYAAVKMDKSKTKQQKQDKIMEVCQVMDIAHCMNTFIGGEEISGLSGGERKRASIAVELLNDPSLLFLDEPTSSLDSTIALILVKLLDKLAKTCETTIIASIRQPNSSVFLLFPQIMLLHEGQVTYFGATTKAHEFLDQAGLHCPVNWNIADYLIDILNDEIFKLLRKKYLESSKEINQAENINYNNENETLKNLKHSTDINNGTKFQAVFRRTVALTSRNTFNGFTVFQYFFAIFVTSIIWYKSSLSEQGLNKIYGLMSFFSSSMFFNVSNIVIFGMETDRLIVRQELRCKLYPFWNYYISAIISQIIWFCMALVIEWTIVYWCTGLPTSPFFLVSMFQYFIFYLFTQAISFFISSFGLGVTENSALTELYFNLNYLIGGFYNKNLAIWATYLQYISLFFINLNNQRSIFVYSNSGIKCNSNESIFQECRAGASYASYDDFAKSIEDHVSPKYLILSSFLVIIILHILSFFSLRRTMKKRVKESSLLMSIVNLVTKPFKKHS